MAILWPAEKEAVSHTVKAWNTRRNVELDGPKALGRSLGRIFPMPGSKIVGKTEQKKLLTSNHGWLVNVFFCISFMDYHFNVCFFCVQIRVPEVTSQRAESNANGGTKWRQDSKTWKNHLRNRFWSESKIFFRKRHCVMCRFGWENKKNRYGHFKSKKWARKITSRGVSGMKISSAANQLKLKN